MDSIHSISFENATDLSSLHHNSIQLIVTSPPYPMIEMWDEPFALQNPEIHTLLQKGNGKETFQKMHAILDQIWRECLRVLEPGGVIAINIGDATRKIGDHFQLYANHARIVQFFLNQHCFQLPTIIWRKPTNGPNKFMGSGMLPSNAYVTLEHEYILLFRKALSIKKFPPKDPARYHSAYFWEERNRWFSDIWFDLKGTTQKIAKRSPKKQQSSQSRADQQELRSRSAAYPLELPLRIIHMYSIQGDTVLDPFWGTGTTTLAAMLTGRNSAGIELIPEFQFLFQERLKNLENLSRDYVETRLKSHEQFVRDQYAIGKEFKYVAMHYNVPVRTKQEQKINFPEIQSFTDNNVSNGNLQYRVSYKKEKNQD